jgi:hypothetical protein
MKAQLKFWLSSLVDELVDAGDGSNLVQAIVSVKLRLFLDSV